MRFKKHLQLQEKVFLLKSYSNFKGFGTEWEDKWINMLTSAFLKKQYEKIISVEGLQ